MLSSVASRRPGRRHSDRGQATVELALCLPLVCLLLLSVVQVAIVVRDQLIVQHAAREAARSASVSGSPATAAAQVVRVVAPNASVTVVASNERVTATVSQSTHTDVPLIGALVPDVVLTASAAMAREPPP
jgi:Flp pilus assembly protein TadG